MKLSVLAALALVAGLGNAAHASCVAIGCAANEQPTTAPKTAKATLGSRIENALKDFGEVPYLWLARPETEDEDLD